MTFKKIFSIILFVFLTFSPAFSESYTKSELESAKQLEIRLAVIGAADPLYSWWGHIAFIIENTETGAAKFYDYGNFSFEQDSFLRNFIMGRMYYLKMASSPERQLKYNAYLNRDITVYTLNVKNADKLDLLQLLENDILPENRVYLYNLFLDNCSTRIRDRMDVITDNSFSKKYMVTSDKTLRVQLRRFLYSNIPMDLLLNFALSGMTDKPVTEYDGMFLPSELARGVENMTVTDADGNKVPFVKNKLIYHESEGRPEVPDYPPPNWQYGLLAGIILGLAALLLKGRARTIYSLILSLLLALLGTLLFFMAFFTDHNYTHWNVNLLFINPLLFVTFALSIRSLKKKVKSVKAVNICWSITVLGALLSVIIKLIPACRQNNWQTLFIVLPAAVIFSGLYTRIRKPRDSRHLSADNL